MNTIADTNRVYHSIYEGRYSLHEAHVAESMDYISKNLNELSDLCLYQKGKKLNLVTVGTGREVQAWANLEVCNVINHFDISKKAVEAVKSINNASVEINSCLVDLCCQPREFLSLVSKLPKADLIYLSGVWHHLEQPFLALYNLGSISNPNAVFMFRIYRSATARWDLVQALRTNFPKPDPRLIIEAAGELFNNLNFGDILKNAPAYYVENYIDNMVVPFCHLFDRITVSDLLESLGAKLHLWTNPFEEGSFGYHGERCTPNGSTIVFTIQNPKKFQNNIKQLHSFRADDLNVLSDIGIQTNKDTNSPLNSEIIAKINEFDEKQKLKLCLFATCLLEAPYIAARFEEAPIFNDTKYNDAFKKVQQASGDFFLETYKSELKELMIDKT